MALNLPFQIGPRTRNVLRIVGFVLLAIVTFVLALQLTFPYNRVKAKVIEALSTKYDVTIRAVERGIMPGRVYFKDVSLRTRPAKADEDATTFFIKELEVDVQLIPLISGTASIDIDATIGSGHLAGNIAFAFNGRSTSIDLVGSDLPSASLPMREAMGLPMSGKLDFSVALSLPSEKSKSGKVAPNWQKAHGAFSFDCASGCTFGDGKTKLKPKLQNARQQAFAEGGIDFGKISVDTMSARVTIKDGRLELTKFDATSQDGELHVDFDLTLAPVLDDSLVNGCLRFKGSDSLQKREPKTHAALTTTGANIGPDGLFHIRLDGKFQKMGRKAQNCGPALKGGNMDDPGGSGTPARPNLTIQPPDDSLKGGPGTTPTINPPAPAPADAATPPTGSPQPPAPSPTGDDKAMYSGSANENPSGGNGAAGSAVAPVPTPPGEPVAPGEGTAGAAGVGGERPQPAD